MTRKHAKSRRKKQGRRSLPRSVPQTEHERLYHEARAAADKGRCAEARSAYEALLSLNVQVPMRAMVENDLAALAAMDGDFESARARLNTALALDPACAPA